MWEAENFNQEGRKLEGEGCGFVQTGKTFVRYEVQPSAQCAVKRSLKLKIFFDQLKSPTTKEVWQKPLKSLSHGTLSPWTASYRNGMKCKELLSDTNRPLLLLYKDQKQGRKAEVPGMNEEKNEQSHGRKGLYIVSLYVWMLWREKGLCEIWGWSKEKESYGWWEKGTAHKTYLYCISPPPDLRCVGRA